MKRFPKTAAALGLLSGCLVSSIQADESNKETRMTINQPLQVQDKLLPPGEYIFMLTTPMSNNSVVSIFNGDRTHLEGIIMGFSTYRTATGSDHLFTISQPSPDRPAKLQQWFYPGNNFGVEFRVGGRDNGSRGSAKTKSPRQNATVAGDVSSSGD